MFWRRFGRRPSVERVIITSSQFVCAPGRLPENDTDYFPETVYGQSKVVTEKLTREANLPCCWTIIRPTNIWGPWHMRYRREFWRVVERGLYVHPGREPVIRCYGYVKNVAHQIRKIFKPMSILSAAKLFIWAIGQRISTIGPMDFPVRSADAMYGSFRVR